MFGAGNLCLVRGTCFWCGGGAGVVSVARVCKGWCRGGGECSACVVGARVMRGWWCRGGAGLVRGWWCGARGGAHLRDVLPACLGLLNENKEWF